MEFALFALTLAGVAMFHRHALTVGLVGLAAITLYKLAGPGFHAGQGLAGLGMHFAAEWVVLVNLFALLTGFALLARHFEDSRIPLALPALLPDDWKGGVALLAIVFVLSSFLDNIAAAIIGGTMAASVYRSRVHVGYLAAIVAAANAGGSGSVIGDTTTTIMWIEGVRATEVLHAYVAAASAFFIFAIPAARAQQRHAPITRDAPTALAIDWGRATIVGLILLAAIATNLYVNLLHPGVADRWPFLGLAVWAAIIATAAWRRPEWSLLPDSVRGSIFLLSLVGCASMMPVEKLPEASWQSAFALGFVSSVFDNIPLTKLALEEGGYDWGVLAYAVGFGGSMIWFGSSAGVAISNRFPEARSVGAWLRHGWFVAVAYPVGFFVLLGVLGWRP